MKNARNQFILLGLICQGFSWDELIMPLVYLALWALCLGGSARKPIRLSPLVESLLLLSGCLLGYGIGLLPGKSTHFFVGHGLAFMQLARLLRPLDRREQVFSLVMAFFHLGVGCTVVLDVRFVLLLLGMGLLIPRVLWDLEQATFPALPGPQPGRPGWRSLLVTLALAGLFFLAFPRGMIPVGLQTNRPGTPDGSSLADTVLDPVRSGMAQSSQTLMQLEGEQVGYLRCFALGKLVNNQWSSYPRTLIRPLTPLPQGASAQGLYRRVRVKQVSYLGRILPTDGEVSGVRGNFFRRTWWNNQHTLETEIIWNSANNLYEFWVQRPSPAQQLSELEQELLTRCPPGSERLQAWVREVISGSTNQLQAARRLESHLRSHFTYRLGAPELRRVEPAEDFVFNQKEGHCERFATSLALFLRMQGIPSRVVVGYVPGTRSWVSQCYNIRFKDAHAWTEAFIQGQGWVQLDATPRASAAVDSTAVAWRDLLDNLDYFWSARVVNFDRPAQSRFWGDLVKPLLGATRRLQQVGSWAVPLLLLAVLGVWLARKVRPWRKRFHLSAKRAPSSLAGRIYQEMLHLLERRGLHRPAHMTPHEFLQTLTGQSLEGLPEIECITRHFCAVRYAQRPLEPAMLLEMKAALDRLRRLPAQAGAVKR